MTTEPTVSDIYYKLGGLEGKLDAALGSLGKDLSGANARLDHHEERIVALEARNARVGGIFWFAPAAITVVAGIVVSFITRHLP